MHGIKYHSTGRVPALCCLSVQVALDET